MNGKGNKNLIFLGPPGAGKGTQARKVAEKYAIPQISTGDLMRAVVSSDSPLAENLKMYMSKGELVPDNLVLDILLARLNNSDCGVGFILDGFPRTVPQAEALSVSLKDNPISTCICIDVPDEELTSRLTARRTCSCGASYHLLRMKPKVDGICDYCGKQLVHRKDDTEEVIANRLAVYHQQTMPLLDFYKQKKLLHIVDGTLKIEMIFSQICDIIDSLGA